MKGPKRAAAGILVFFAASILTVHLAYEREAAPALGFAPAVDPAASPGPRAPATPPRAAVASAPAADVRDPPALVGPPYAAAPVRMGGRSAPPPVATDIPLSEPGPLATGRERDLDACVERAIGAASEPKASAPGRWPAIKRAREELRRRRLAARADCARELAM
jgi:hypothetical protein